MKNSYKLLKWYPSLPTDWEAGMVVAKGDGHPMFTPVNDQYGYSTISKTELSSNEFWSPYLLTTEDLVDVYKGDEFWPCQITKEYYHRANADNGHLIQDLEWKYFSTKEAAEKWLAEKSIPEYVECTYSQDNSKSFTVGRIYNWPSPTDNDGVGRYIPETHFNGLLWGFKPSTKEAYEAQQKPNWKKGEWLMVKDNSMFGDVNKMLFRFDHFGGEANGYVYGYESYTIWKTGKVEVEPDGACMCHKTEAVPATSKEIESVLSKVAEYKGFKPGTKVVPFEGLVETEITGEWTYFYWSDMLYAASLGGGGLRTYCKGKWATLIEEPKPVQQPKQFPIKVKWGTNSVVESEERNCIVDFDVDGKVTGFEIL